MNKLHTYLASISLGILIFSGTAQATSVTVDGTHQWIDTGIDVIAGELLTITASGQVVHNPSFPDYANTDGIGTGHDDLNNLVSLDGTLTGDVLGGGFLVDSAIALSLVGKIGITLVTEGVSGKGAGFVGSSYSQVALDTGRLYLSFNDMITDFGDNSGSFSVEVNAVPVPAAIWLFGSGFIGLIGFARRKKS